MNAAHELAHVLFGDCELTRPTTRKQNDERLNCLSPTAPNNQLKLAFTGKSMVRLVQFKRNLESRSRL